MNGVVQKEVKRLRRRVGWALFLRGTSEATLVLALALAGVLLALRFVEIPVQPAPWWLAGLVVPPLFGVFRSRRHGFGDITCAAHLDRRWGLGGLLLTSAECDAAAWRSTLQIRLAEAQKSLPTQRVQPLVYRAVMPAVVLAIVLLLPALPSMASSTNALIEDALDKFEAKIEIAREEARIDEKSRSEMETRLKKLREDHETGKGVDWSDVDALENRLAHEQSLANTRAERTRAALAELAQRARTGRASASDLARLLEKAGGEALLSKLPKGLADKLSKGDIGALSPDELGQLAKALDQALEGDPQAGNSDGEYRDPTELEDLRRLIESENSKFGKTCAACKGKGCSECDGSGSSKPGRGGITRGRGDASLQNSNDTQGDTNQFEARRLPRGAAVSREWDLIGVSRSRPDGKPTRDAGAGSAGSAGSGAVSWHRRLAPRHRDVVRKFFSERPSNK